MSSPICVTDQFHFSHYYWRSWDLSSGANPEEQEPQDGSDSEDDPGLPAPPQLYKPQPAVPEDIRLKFYNAILDDGSNNIHFGKWDGIDVTQEGAYGRASDALTAYMWELARQRQPHRVHCNDNDDNKILRFVDLGSGTAASALQIVRSHQASTTPVHGTCLNLCHEQNVQAKAFRDDENLQSSIDIVEGTFEDAPFAPHVFDVVFSQDAFIHAVSKLRTYQEAFRVTKPGGAMVFCDLMAGPTPDWTQAERDKFASTNLLNDWKTPEQNVSCLLSCGWKDVQVVDLTNDMRISFQLMLKKVNYVLEHGGRRPHVRSNMNQVLLRTYARKIQTRLVQIDQGVFCWCVVHGRKPVGISLMCEPPVPFMNTSNLLEILSPKEEDTEKETLNASEDFNDSLVSLRSPLPQMSTSIVVVDILQKMTRERIAALPDTVELLITLSAGLDHIDMQACNERGIAVQQSGRAAITSHVVQYVLAFLIIGLRDALSQLGVPFPSKGWNLNWNCQIGKPLTDSVIAVVGMGVIANELCRQIRLLAPHTRILYYVPECFRDSDAETKYNLEYFNNVGDMASLCDVLLPMCPLNKHTTHVIDAKVLNRLRPDAGLINMARGKVVDTDALTAALQEGKIQYAILDTTFPEPLPTNHPLWSISNCFILPHFATNTMAVRKALVEEIQPMVEEFYGLGFSDAKLREQERSLRLDLAVAHQLTAQLNMDMLVWNHISARFKSGCLITPGRKLWKQITPEDLVYSSSNVTADIIHDAIYKARGDIGAIIHLHTPAATAVSCLQDGFVPLTQDAAYFYNRVISYEWDGVSDDASEGPAITAAIQNGPSQANTLLMNNHGFVCFGKTIKEVWVLAYYFERCCEVQLRVMQSGGKIRQPPASVMAQAATTSYLPEFAPGVCEWDALCADIQF
jgi:phosphoglycerate dehydrogenase-like enzyme/ribulose-5-phosphate 4-epimerase/fuculose-1-phosphate aldolase/SAM-dependent methyltransferase